MLLDFDAKKREAAAAELGDNAAFYKVDVSDYDRSVYQAHSLPGQGREGDATVYIAIHIAIGHP